MERTALEALLGRLEEQLGNLVERSAKIEAAVAVLLQQRTVKEFYTTKEAAKMLGVSNYTVREWCRYGRIAATKLPHGRGNEGEWRIAHEELVRHQKEGLRPRPPQADLR